MGCLPNSPSVGLQRIFNRTRCVLACCGGKVIEQNSEFCDGEENWPVFISTQVIPYALVAAVYRVVKEEGKSKCFRK